MHDNSRPHILCIDDDGDARNVITTVFPLLKVTFTRSFAQGFRLIRWHPFDLYLLDQYLPGPSGIEFCRKIRSSDANTPVVMFSPAGYPSDPGPALEAGATAYLDMPSDLPRLEGTVIGLLQQAHARSVDARVAEIRAVQSEIRQHLALIDGLKQEHTEAMTRVRDRLFRTRAYAAFIDSGGVRSYFERLWPDVLSDSSSE